MGEETKSLNDGKEEPKETPGIDERVDYRIGYGVESKPKDDGPFARKLKPMGFGFIEQ